MGRLAVVLGVLVVAMCLDGNRPAHAAGPGIEITSVGHEGFLLRGGKAAVLLDAFLGPGELERDTLARRATDAVLAGEAPFDRVTVALISHPHDDHFDPMVAGRFLEAHPQVVFAAVPDVHAALRKGFPRYAGIKARVTDVKWGATGRASKVLNGVRVDFVRVSHEASEFYSDEVALHIVHLNGVNVLHAADPELLHGRLEALHLENESLDVAFLPYSFLTSPGADKLFAEHVRAKQVVAMHLPAAGTDEAKAAVLRQFPGALFLITPLQSIRR